MRACPLLIKASYLSEAHHSLENETPIKPQWDSSTNCSVMFTTVILKISFFSEFVLLRSLRPQKRIRSLISFCGLAVGVFQKLANYKLNWSLLASWAMKLKLCVSQSNFDLVPNLFSNAKISQVSTHEVGEGLKKQGKPLMNFALFANLHTRLNYDSWLQEFMKQDFSCHVQHFKSESNKYLQYIWNIGPDFMSSNCVQ